MKNLRFSFNLSDSGDEFDDTVYFKNLPFYVIVICVKLTVLANRYTPNSKNVKGGRWL